MGALLSDTPRTFGGGVTGTGEIGSPVSFSMLDAGGSWATFIDTSALGTALGTATSLISIGASAAAAVSETAWEGTVVGS